MIGYELTLPLSPTINHYYMRNRNGGVRISQAGQDFRWEVLQAVKKSKMPKLTGRLCLVVRVYQRTRVKSDISNYVKALEDALQVAGAFENDEQIDDIQVIRGGVMPGGKIEVMIGEITCQK